MYVPEISQLNGKYLNASPITLFQPAMHISGLAREPDDAENYSSGPLSEWEKSLVAPLPQAKYAAEPGTNFSYREFGSAVLRLALSRAAHQLYDEDMTRNIFHPPGVHHTAIQVTPEIQSSPAAGYAMKDGKANSQNFITTLRSC